MAIPREDPRLSDEQVVELALQQDEWAYGELVRRHREFVFQKACEMLGDWDQADSVAQETFRRAFRHLKKHNPEYKFSSWLLRIARNVALKRLEKKKIEIEPLDRFSFLEISNAPKDTAVQVPDRGADPLQSTLSREREELIRQALPSLTPRQREAFLLYREQVSQQEMAERMGVPLNTARSHLHRACQRLADVLREPREDVTPQAH